MKVTPVAKVNRDVPLINVDLEATKLLKLVLKESDLSSHVLAWLFRLCLFLERLALHNQRKVAKEYFDVEGAANIPCISFAFIYRLQVCFI